ncbi:hypothetical protein D3C86_2089980 [compost metagenome]
MIPIDKEVASSENYQYKSVFHLKHAVYTRYIGDPFAINSRYEGLMAFISKNGLQPITPAYNFNINDRDMINSDSLTIDIYMGVNPSIL